MFQVIHPTLGIVAVFDTLERCGKFMATSHVVCSIRAVPMPDRRDALGLAETRFRPRQDTRHPRGFRPMPGPGVRP